MDNILGIHIQPGGHLRGNGDLHGCVMEWVHTLWLTSHGWNFEAAWDRLSDNPPCTDDVVTFCAVAVNDRLADADRQRLLAFIPRLMAAQGTSDQEKQHRIEKAVIRAFMERWYELESADKSVSSIGWDSDILPDRGQYNYMMNILTGAMNDDGRIDLLDLILTAHEKARAEEGCLADDPVEPPSLEECVAIEQANAEWVDEHFGQKGEVTV